MDSSTSEYATVFIATYLLVALFLLMFKAGLNDLRLGSRRRMFLELRAVHPIALLAAFVSLAPMAIVRRDIDSSTTVISIIAASAIYFLVTLLYRHKMGIRLMDFSIDNGSNFNDEVSADPTAAQRTWLYMVSWAGALTLGVLSGFLISFNTWKDNTDWLTQRPTDDEARIYLLIFVGVIIVSILLFNLLRSRRMRRLPTAQRLRRAVNRAWFVPALFGLAIAFLQDFTRNTTLTNRYWTISIFVIMVLVSLWNLVFVLPNLRRHLAEDRQFFEQQLKKIRRQRNKKRKKNRR